MNTEEKMNVRYKKITKSEFDKLHGRPNDLPTV